MPFNLISRQALRFIFRQRRHIWQSNRRRLFIELRGTSADNEAFLQALEHAIAALAEIKWVRYVPALERLGKL